MILRPARTSSLWQPAAQALLFLVIRTPFFSHKRFQASLKTSPSMGPPWTLSPPPWPPALSRRRAPHCASTLSRECRISSPKVFRCSPTWNFPIRLALLPPLLAPATLKTLVEPAPRILTLARPSLTSELWWLVTLPAMLSRLPSNLVLWWLVTLPAMPSRSPTNLALWWLVTLPAMPSRSPSNLVLWWLVTLPAMPSRSPSNLALWWLVTLPAMPSRSPPTLALWWLVTLPAMPSRSPTNRMLRRSMAPLMRLPRSMLNLALW